MSKKKKYIHKKNRSASKQEPPSLNKKNLRGDLMNLFRGSSDKISNYKQISARLGARSQEDRKLILASLNELVEAGMLREPERGKFSIDPSQLAVIQGVIDFTKSGTAYVIPDEDGEDIFVTRGRTGVALHGDRVEVSIIGVRHGQPEGQVINVINRLAENYVGVIELTKKHAFVVASSPRIHVDFFVDGSKLKGAKDGEKVVVKLLDWTDPDSSPFAEVVSVLGPQGDNEVEMHAILVEFGLPYEFPDAVLAAAEKIDVTISAKEISRRKDFRSIPTFTIDPDDAKDFDDALSIRKLDDKMTEIGIHIADVSHYVHPGSIIEREAEKRATSVYLVDRVVPMLPEVLSNFVCSLRPGEDKLCMSAVFHIDDHGKIHKEWFGRTVINSNKRFTYDEAQAIIEGRKDEFSDEILELHHRAQTMRKTRFASGALEFSSVEVKFELDKTGRPIRIYEKKMREANFLIEEFMLLANKRVATHFGKPEENQKAKPFVYRIHDLPDPDKLMMLKDFVGHLGYKLQSAKPEKASYALNDLIRQVEGKPEEDVVKIMAIRSMSKAVYSTENIGHYGLAFDYYTHFTSPIRRYPDVMVHRLIQRYEHGQNPPAIADLEKDCKHSSAMEKKAADAERASIKYKQVEFMLDKVGQIYDGTINGLTRWGMFVELADIKIEGMVPVNTLSDDIYHYDERKNRLVGKKYKEVYEFGGKVRIRVHSADLMLKQLDFRII